MRRLWPLPKGALLIAQTAVVILFSLALYWNLSLYVETKNVKRACVQLEQESARLDRISRKIEKFDKIKKAFVPDGAKGISYRWEDVELEFEPVDFASLLARLSLLNHEIEEKYKKHGLFVLTRFETVRKDMEQGSQNPEQKSTVKPARPGFKITGRLLCM